MAATYDTVGGGDQDAGGAGKTPYTWTHVGAAGITGVVVMFYSSLSDFGQAVTGVMYGSSPMSLIATQSDGNVGKLTIWSLASPASGSVTVTVTLAGAGYGGGNSISVTGGDTSTVLSATGGASGNSSAPSSGVTSAVGELVMDLSGSTGQTGTPTAGGSQSSKWTAISGGGNALGMSTQPGASGTVTSSWTSSQIGFWASGSASFKAGAAAGGLFLSDNMNGLQVGGPFFANPLN